MNNNVSGWFDGVRTGVSDALRQVITYIPHLVAALLVLVVGVIVAYILKAVIVRILRFIKLKPYLEQIGLNQIFPGKYDFVELVGDLVKWFFIVVFLLQALSIANLLQVNDLVRGLLAYLPNVAVAVVLVLVGSIVADLAERIVVGTARVVGVAAAVFLGSLARYTIWVLVIFTALAQLKVNTVFLDRAFTGLVAMLALAGGLAFGLGGREVAKDLLESLRSNLRKDK